MNKFYKVFSFLYYKSALKEPKKTFENLKYFYKQFKYENIKNNEVSITKENFRIMKKAFKKMILSSPESAEIVKYFLEADLSYEEKKINLESIEQNSPILICVVKDDLQKIKKMYEHHKNIGIEHFVFIDNGSTDGTLEFLKQQKGVDVINSKTKYYTLAREAWINRVLCHYGYNRWYLVVDSDEMFNYIGSEQTSINKHIQKLLDNNIKRELSFMLDMYSNAELFKDMEDFTKECCYFDKDTYEVNENKRFIKITGGPRKRNFREKGQQKEFMLGKYPLSMFEKGDIQSNSHFTFPFYKNIKQNCTSVLMHYKFIGNDIEKYKLRIKEKNYHNGSEDYKAYINNYDNNKEMNFYYNGSEKYINSNSLEKINILSKV